MTAVFQIVLNMSITGAFIAAAIMVLRLLLRRLPRKYSYLLWLILAIRLLCPVALSSDFSMFNLVRPRTEKNRMIYLSEKENVPLSAQMQMPPDRMQTPPDQMQMQPNQTQNTMQETEREIWAPGERYETAGIKQDHPAWEERYEMSGLGQALPAAQEASAKPKIKKSLRETTLEAASGIWLAGLLLLALYTVISCLRVRRKTAAAEYWKDNIYYCGQIESPFVFGIWKPCIYLPRDIPDGEEEYILAHETVHIQRGDHIVKLAAMVTLCLHWFNPFVWISYRLMMRDMELSCDERALLRFHGDVRAAYARTLLNMSARQNGIALGGILSFGESYIKMRVKGVLRSKKPRWIAAAAAIALIAVASLGLLTNAQKKSVKEKHTEQGKDGQERESAEKDADDKEAHSPEDSEAGAEEKVYFGDLDGNGQEEYGVNKGLHDFYAGKEGDGLFFYFNGEMIYERTDDLYVYMTDAYYLDLDADGENEVFLGMWQICNDPSQEYVVLKKDYANEWRRLEVMQNDAFRRSEFPIRVAFDREREEAVITLEGLAGKQVSFDMRTHYAHYEEDASRYLASDTGDGYTEMMIWYEYRDYLDGSDMQEDVGKGSLCTVTPNEYAGRPCLIATHVMSGYGAKYDCWGYLNVWFDYDYEGRIRFLDMDFTAYDADFWRTWQDEGVLLTSPREWWTKEETDARKAYAGILRELLQDGRLPDGDGFERPYSAQFAVCDADGDGKEELILLCDPGVTAGRAGYVIDYDARKKEAYIQQKGFPQFAFLENGNLKVYDPHNQTYGKMWPYTLYRYMPESDSYEPVGHVHAADRELYEINGRQGYPQWADTSDTGRVYYIGAGGGWGDDPVDESAYLAWRMQNGGEARETAVFYQPVTKESVHALEEGYLMAARSKEPESGSETWPDNEFTAVLPKPETGTIVKANTDDRYYFSITINGWTLEDALAYAERLKSLGFDQNISESLFGDLYYYNASNGTYWAIVGFRPGWKDKGSVGIEKPGGGAG